MRIITYESEEFPMKKQLSLLLATAMLVATLLCLLPMSVSADATLTTDKTTYTEGESILVNASGSGKDWVGIYLESDSVGSIDSIRWYYVEGHNENYDISTAGTNDSRSDYLSLPEGKYTIYLLENDGYNVLANVTITITKAPAVEKTLSTDKDEYTEGDPILVTATGTGNDWVGLFKKDEIPGGDNVFSIYWYYVAKGGNSSGDAKKLQDGELHDNNSDLANLPAGEYKLYLLENDGYNSLATKTITIKAAETPDQPDTPVNPDAPKTGSELLPVCLVALLTLATLTLCVLPLTRRSHS